MNYKQCYTYKFLMKVGMIFWLFVIPSALLLMFNLETGMPEPTLISAILFISGFLLSLLWFLGSYVIIPLSYFIFFILLVLDVYRVCFNKLPNQINTNTYHYIYIILAILGFIFGGVTSILTILGF